MRQNFKTLAFVCIIWFVESLLYSATVDPLTENDQQTGGGGVEGGGNFMPGTM